MGPNSLLIVLALLVGAVLALQSLVRGGSTARRLGAGALAILLSMTSGLFIVNDYYGYYRSWTDAARDLFGGAPAEARAVHLAASKAPASEARGVVQSIQIKGIASGIDRQAFIYFPPQYFEKQYAKTRFPVMELFHGSPGSPSNWLNQLHVARVVDTLIADHQMGPVVLVMPAISTGDQYTECLDSPRGLDETYLVTDVPRFIRARFRVSTNGAEWGALGYSSGGYCAANLALQHRSAYGAIASLDGYYTANDGPAAGVLGDDPALMLANSPLDEAASLAPGSAPIPRMWIMSGSGSEDQQPARAFASVMSRLEQVEFTLVKGANHDFYAWQSALPDALQWTWRQIASPELQVDFPLLPGHRIVLRTGTVSSRPHDVTIRGPHHPRPSHSPSPSGSPSPEPSPHASAGPSGAPQPSASAHPKPKPKPSPKPSPHPHPTPTPSPSPAI